MYHRVRGLNEGPPLGLRLRAENFLRGLDQRHETPTIGRCRAPGACEGTAGETGAVGSIRS